ncbi:MAG: AAA family ATPase [Sphingorhabdus sp.]
MNAKGQRYLITGCSGAGKSSLLNELSGRGFITSQEPGRQIVKEQIAAGGDALPWQDKIAFGRLLADATIASFDAMLGQEGPVFFDRGAPDIFAWFDQIGERIPAKALQALQAISYNSPVFLAPPWQEIYRQDEERPKPFSEAMQEYEMIIRRLEQTSSKLAILPRASICERADFIEDCLS